MFALVGCLEHKAHCFLPDSSSSLLVSSFSGETFTPVSIFTNLAISLLCVCVCVGGRQPTTHMSPSLCCARIPAFFSTQWSFPCSLCFVVYLLAPPSVGSLPVDLIVAADNNTVYYTANNTVVCLPGLLTTRGGEANNDRKGIMRAQSG